MDKVHFKQGDYTEKLCSKISTLVFINMKHTLRIISDSPSLFILILLLIWLFRLSHSFIIFWFYFVPLYIWLYIWYASVYFCKLCILIVIYVPFGVFCFIMFFCVLFVCKCVLYYCHRVSTQLQLTNISRFFWFHLLSLCIRLYGLYASV